ncbi:adenylate kinase family protein [Halalkalicoccus tibetensis]|uniref:Putative adenylate kinase n=1 Tax=Halalkalicoccus tibetensis TaxID=175632 RepID=A0ABD5V2F0_9EURY
MRVVVTGTPGTGKTSATEPLTDHDVLHLNEVVEREGLYTERDEERDSLVVDMDALGEYVDDREGIVESHLAHHLPADRVVVLRCAPDELERRLRERGESEPKASENNGSTKSPQALARYARENAESEALDLILSEAVAEHGLESVYEIDTTDRSPEEVAEEIERVIDGEREPSAGEVEFS